MTLRVGVVGLGVGEQHLRGFATHPGCEVVAICDLDPAKLDAVARTYPSASLTEEFADLIADRSIDIVSIASFDDHHFEQVLASLRAGKHVFCEKPLCRTVAEARSLKEAWLTVPGLALSSNLVLRAAPLYRWLRDGIVQGEFGSIYAFDGDYLYGRLHKVTDGWRKDVEDYSVMLGGGVHLVDLLLWLTGERPSSVAAAGNRISTEGTAFRYLDFVSATLCFPSELIGRVTANFGSVHRHQHVVRVFGTKATFVYDDMGPRLHRSRDPETAPEAVDLDPLPRSKAELIPDFVRQLTSGDVTRSATQHEFDVICVCAAVDEALAKGAEIDIEYV